MKKILGYILMILGSIFLFSTVAITIIYLEIANIHSKEFIPSILFLLGSYLFVVWIIYSGFKLIKKEIQLTPTISNELLDDITYIQDIKQEKVKQFFKYTILLDARGYGWDDMKSWADYMSENDLKNLYSITVSEINSEPQELLKDKNIKYKKISELESIQIERSTLSIAGRSVTLDKPVRIVWYNQTRVLAIYTLIDDLELMRRYAETVIRRSFNTKDAMKLAKSRKQDQKDTEKRKTFSIQSRENFEYEDIISILEELKKLGCNVQKIVTNGEDSGHDYTYGFKKEYKTMDDFFKNAMHDYNKSCVENYPHCDWDSTIIYLTGVLNLQIYISNNNDNTPYKLTLSINDTQEELILKAIHIVEKYDMDKNKKSKLHFDSPKINYFKRKAYHHIASYYFASVAEDIQTLFFDMDIILSNVIDTTSMQDVLKETKESIQQDSSPKKCLVHLSLLSTMIEKYLDDVNQEILVKKVENSTSENLIKAWHVLDYWFKGINARSFANYIHAQILTKLKEETIEPVKIVDQNIYLDSSAYIKYLFIKPVNYKDEYKTKTAIHLSESEPILHLFDDGIKTNEYKLQTKNDEDFKNKYYMIMVRLNLSQNTKTILAQIDGFISDTDEDRKFTTNDIGYRMEGYILRSGGVSTEKIKQSLIGADLVEKGLRYPGYITPTNVRLIGICPKCKKSFTFTGYFCHHGQYDVAYSDDGLDVCVLSNYEIDKENFSFEFEGKTYRYYNSFNCPHCLEPYIDYKKYPNSKIYGVLGCVHLGKSYVEVINNSKSQENE